VIAYEVPTATDVWLWSSIWPHVVLQMVTTILEEFLFFMFRAETIFETVNAKYW